MCLASSADQKSSSISIPSVGLKKIGDMCHAGGSAVEDVPKRSISSPDLMSYFEGIVYASDP
jgi:hypothetical protein